MINKSNKKNKSTSDNKMPQDLLTASSMLTSRDIASQLHIDHCSLLKFVIMLGEGVIIKTGTHKQRYKLRCCDPSALKDCRHLDLENRVLLGAQYLVNKEDFLSIWKEYNQAGVRRDKIIPSSKVKTIQDMWEEYLENGEVRTFFQKEQE